jgi:hypothetical protein
MEINLEIKYHFYLILQIYKRPCLTRSATSVLAMMDVWIVIIHPELDWQMDPLVNTFTPFILLVITYHFIQHWFEFWASSMRSDLVLFQLESSIPGQCGNKFEDSNTISILANIYKVFLDLFCNFGPSKMNGLIVIIYPDLV